MSLRARRTADGLPVAGSFNPEEPRSSRFRSHVPSLRERLGSVRAAATRSGSPPPRAGLLASRDAGRAAAGRAGSFNYGKNALIMTLTDSNPTCFWQPTVSQYSKIQPGPSGPALPPANPTAASAQIGHTPQFFGGARTYSSSEDREEAGCQSYFFSESVWRMF